MGKLLPQDADCSFPSWAGEDMVLEHPQEVLLPVAMPASELLKPRFYLSDALAVPVPALLGGRPAEEEVRVVTHGKLVNLWGARQKQEAMGLIWSVVMRGTQWQWPSLADGWSAQELWLCC